MVQTNNLELSFQNTCIYERMFIYLNIHNVMATKLKTRINTEKLERAAYVLKAVAHPTRINIIDLLDQQKELSVTEISEHLDCEQSLLSHHLTNMRDKGILAVRREGKNMFYSLTDKTITKIISCINDSGF